MAQTITTSADRTEVVNAIAGLSNGDTLQITNSSATWATPVTVTPAISIIGAGVGQTIINLTGGAFVLNTSSAYDNTSLSLGKPSYRVSGISFTGGGGNILALNGNSGRVRVDHCNFGTSIANPTSGVIFHLGNTADVRGVIDHCVAYNLGQFASINHGGWTRGGQVPVGSQSDTSWAYPNTIGNAGGGDAMYLEDNTFTGAGGATVGFTDGEYGGRACVRYNELHNCTVGNHGTQNGNRGARHWEIYGNRFLDNPDDRVCVFRSGSGVCWGNVSTKTNLPSFLLLQDYRAENYGTYDPGTNPWNTTLGGGVTGTNPMDLNDPTLFDSGTAAQTSTTTLIVTGKNWSPVNKWKGYTLLKTSGVTTGQCAGIIFSDANSITYGSASNAGDKKCDSGSHTVPVGCFPLHMEWTAGDGWQIHRCLEGIDFCTGADPVRLDRSNMPTSLHTSGSSGNNFTGSQLHERAYGWNNLVGANATPAVQSGTTVTADAANGTLIPAIRASPDQYAVLGGNAADSPTGHTHFYNRMPVATEIFYFTSGYVPFTYPHPLTVEGVAPAITGTGSFQFTKGTNADCAANPKINCCTFTAVNFTNTPTWSISVGTLPAGLTLGTTGVTVNLSGNPSGNAGQTNVTIHAASTSPTQTADFAFTAQVTAPNTKPTCSISASPTSGIAPLNINLTATVTDQEGPVVRIRYYRGATQIADLHSSDPVPTPPLLAFPNYTDQGVAAGTYSYTAIASDQGAMDSDVSTAVAVTLTQAALIAPTIVVSATADQPPPVVVVTKKILHWQATNNNRVSVVQSNKTYIDTLPFDGLVVSTGSNQDLLGPTSVVNYGILTTEISPMNGLLANVTHNYFVVMPGNSGMQDPFDSWTQTINNFVLIARVCKEQGLEGIFFDNEEYNVHWWTYPGDVAHAGSHNLAAYQAEWRQRGKDAMAAMIAEWPAIKIVHTIGPNRSVTAAPFSGGFSGNPNWLGGYFFMGMFEQVPTGNHVISGGELYYLRTATHFSTTKTFMDTIYNQGNTALLTPSFNSTWLANDDLSWGIYDQDSGDPPAVNGGVDMTAAILQTTLQNAVPNADEFVWNYSESGLEWLTSGGGSAGAWQNAVRAARATLGLPTL